jgi:hypothetical protein
MDCLLPEISTRAWCGIARLVDAVGHNHHKDGFIVRDGTQVKSGAHEPPRNHGMRRQYERKRNQRGPVNHWTGRRRNGISNHGCNRRANCSTAD